MKKKSTLVTFIFLKLKKFGLLCKKNKEEKKLKIRIQKTLNHKGEIISHEDFMFAKNNLPHIHKINKDKKICHYDFRKHTCRCGINIDLLRRGEKCRIIGNIDQIIIFKEDSVKIDSGWSIVYSLSNNGMIRRNYKNIFTIHK